MNEFFRTIYSYVFVLIHPFRSHEYFRCLRNSGRRHVLEKLKPLSLEESVSVSWIFEILGALYYIVSIYAVVYSGKNVHGFLFLSNVALVGATLAWILFFPFFTWIYVKVWMFLINFFARIYGIEGDIKQAIAEVMSSSLSSNFLMVIPFFGDAIRRPGQMILIFAGLRRNIGMTTIQSVFVLIAPALIVFLFLVTMVSYLFLLFSICF